MNGVIELIISRLGEPVGIHLPEYQFYCPFCLQKNGSEDRRGHLYVNEDKGYFCHRCEARGSVAWLLKTLGFQPEDIRTRIPELDTLQKQIVGAMTSPLAPNPIQAVTLPENVEEVRYMPEVAAYAVRRGLGEFDWNHYGLLAWTDEFQNPRLLFPDYSDNGVLVYWTARAVRNGVKPKYKAAQNSERSRCVWNLNRVNRSRPIYIAEGILSARACGSNGVAIYGKYLSDAQLTMISNRAGPEGVRIILDGDAWQSTVRAAEKFMRRGVPCGIVDLPLGVDPDETPRDILGDLLRGSKPIEDHEILQMKISHVPMIARAKRGDR